MDSVMLITDILISELWAFSGLTLKTRIEDYFPLKPLNSF